MGARKSETSFRKKTKALISLAYYVSELLGKGTIDKKSSGETKGRQGSSSRNFDVLGRELFTPDEVRKLDNKKCIVFIRGIDPIMDGKYIPFAHPMFQQTADGKGIAYIHMLKDKGALIGKPYEILSAKALEHFEKRKANGDNVYIDTLTYEEFMILGEVEMSKRFTNLDEKEQKDKLNKELEAELEYAEEMNQKVNEMRQVNRPKLKEDTITSRMIHWPYTKEQKEEARRAMDAKIPQSKILEYFYPETAIDQMTRIRESLTT